MKAFLIAGALAVAITLGACGKKGDPKPPETTPAAQAQTEDAKKKKQ